MRELLRTTAVITKREFLAYFSTPLAAVFLIVFVALTGAFTFYVGNFFQRGEADLSPTTPGSISCSSPRSPCGCGPKSARAGPSSSS